MRSSNVTEACGFCGMLQDVHVLVPGAHMDNRCATSQPSPSRSKLRHILCTVLTDSVHGRDGLLCCQAANWCGL